MRFANVNTTVTVFYSNISDLVTKLVNQEFNMAALRKKFLKFYHSKLNVLCNYGVDIYEHVINFFNKGSSFVSEDFISYFLVELQEKLPGFVCFTNRLHLRIICRYTLMF